jgi:hypothetical protein
VSCLFRDAVHGELLGISEGFEEGEQLVGWAVATGGSSRRCGAGQRLLLECKVSV